MYSQARFLCLESLLKSWCFWIVRFDKPRWQNPQAFKPNKFPHIDCGQLAAWFMTWKASEYLIQFCLTTPDYGDMTDVTVDHKSQTVRLSKNKAAWRSHAWIGLHANVRVKYVGETTPNFKEMLLYMELWADYRRVGGKNMLASGGNQYYMSVNRPVLACISHW